MTLDQINITLKRVLSQWHEQHRAEFVARGYSNLLPTFDEREEKHTHTGAKYIRLDVGGSGAWMLDIATGIIYGIKGYGTPDKKKIAGDLNDPAFDGALLHHDRFRHGRFDNRRTHNFGPCVECKASADLGHTASCSYKVGA